MQGHRRTIDRNSKSKIFLAWDGGDMLREKAAVAKKRYIFCRAADGRDRIEER